MKKFLEVFIVAFVIIGIALYRKIYFIENTNEKLEKGIESVLSVNNIIDNVELKLTREVGQRKYVLYTRDDGSFAQSELKKGLNGNYTVESTTYRVEGGFIEKIEKSQKENYFILSGSNIDKRLNYAIVGFNGQYNKIEIPKDDYFIAYCEIPKNIKSSIAEKLQFFDDNGNNITLDLY